MGLFDFLRRGQPATKSTYEALMFGASDAAWTRADYASLASSGYAGNVYVYRSIEVLGRAVGGIDWYLTRPDGEPAEGNPLEALWARPNPEMGTAQFLHATVAYLMLAGNAYVLRVGPDNRPPLELYLLRPDLVRRINGSGDVATRYEYSTGQRSVVYGADQVLHLKTFNPTDPTVGVSPLAAARYSLDANNSAKRWNVGLLQNATRPSGVLSLEGNLTPDQREHLQEQLERRLQGRNAARPLVLEGGMSWQQIGLDAGEVSWLEGMKMSAREIALAFGVPPVLIGDADQATYSNYQTARRSLYTETVLPMMDWLGGEFNRFLTPAFGGVVLNYDTDDIEALSEDVTPLWDRTIKAVQAGILTTNEAREALGYGPLELPAPTSAPQPATASAGARLEAKLLEVADQASLWTSVETKREVYYQPVERQVRGRFAAEEAALVAALEDSGGDADKTLAALEGQRGAWLSLYAAIYNSVAEPFANDLEAELGQGEPKAAGDLYDPPQAVRREFAKGLTLHEQGLSGDGLVPATVRWARRIADGGTVTWDKLVQMRAWFARHEADRKPSWDDPPTPGYVAWLLWGGDAGRAWAERTLAAEERSTSSSKATGWQEWLTAWLQTEGAKRIVGILETTRAQLRTTLLEGILAGESIPKLAARLRAVYGAFGAQRATVIARTETIAASNAARQAVAETSGRNLRKVWLSTADPRTRDDHLMANGQSVPANAPFSVGGSKLMFPGDTSLGAPGSQTIQCRCTLYYEPEE